MKPGKETSGSGMSLQYQSPDGVSSGYSKKSQKPQDHLSRESPAFGVQTAEIVVKITCRPGLIEDVFRSKTGCPGVFRLLLQAAGDHVRLFRTHQGHPLGQDQSLLTGCLTCRHTEPDHDLRRGFRLADRFMRFDLRKIEMFFRECFPFLQRNFNMFPVKGSQIAVFGKDPVVGFFLSCQMGKAQFVQIFFHVAKLHIRQFLKNADAAG